jgi:hypothetical protein
LKIKKTLQVLSTAILLFMFNCPAFAADKSMKSVNPFELPPGVYSKDNIPEEIPQTLILEAIFTIEGQKIATISGQNFFKGDFAFGKRVAQIFKNRVVLEDGGKEENLILENTKFTIRKHMQN